MPETLKVLIVDDEYHARKLMSEYVSKLEFLELAGTVSNVFEAMSILRNEDINIMLLDIQMPEITGLEFAHSLKHPPAIIFTTAYSDYAVESYELDVVDYLLKPVSFPRFIQAVNKVIERRGNNNAPTTSSLPVPIPKQVATDAVPTVAQSAEESIVIKSGYKFYKINYSDLLYVEGQKEYVTFYTTKQRITTLYSLKDLEEKLPSALFKRIHKSYIISVNHIELIDKNILHIAGKGLPIGASYKEELMKLFEQSNGRQI